MASLLFLIASDKHTGPATVALQHTRMMKQAGHDCVFIAWPNGSLQRQMEGSGIWQSHSLRLPTRATGAISFCTDILKLKRLLREWQIDAIFSYRTADHLIAASASGGKIPVIRFLHHGLYDCKGWLRRVGLKRLLFGKRTSTVLSPNLAQTCRLFYEKHPEAVYRSAAASQDEIALAAGQHGFHTIHAAINTDVFCPAQREMLRVERRKELGFSDNDIVIVFPARMKWGRGHFRFVDAFAKAVRSCPSLKALFVGDGEEHEKIMPLVQARGIQENVVWVKDAGAQFAATVACGDIGFLFDPGSAGTARGALEMMGMAIPVVCSRIGVLAELRGFDNNTVTLPQTPVTMTLDSVEPDNANDAFAAAFLWLAQNPEQRRIMGSTAARMVTSRFSEEALTQKLQSILASALPSSSR